jgi:hypothetical protein
VSSQCVGAVASTWCHLHNLFCGFCPLMLSLVFLTLVFTIILLVITLRGGLLL